MRSTTAAFCCAGVVNGVRLAAYCVSMAAHASDVDSIHHRLTGTRAWPVAPFFTIVITKERIPDCLPSKWARGTKDTTAPDDFIAVVARLPAVIKSSPDRDNIGRQFPANPFHNWVLRCEREGPLCKMDRPLGRTLHSYADHSGVVVLESQACQWSP